MNSLHGFVIVVLTVLFSIIGFCLNTKIAYDENGEYRISIEHQLFFKNHNEKDWKLFEPLANVHVTAITIGGFNNEKHFLALDTEGQVWAWGPNDHGQLGLADRTIREYPTIIPDITHIVGIASDCKVSLAWDQDGNLWGFGTRFFDILDGLGRGQDHLTPKKIPNLPPIKEAKIGSYYAIAIGKDGACWVWGQNFVGKIGCGEIEKVNVPTCIERVSPVIQISPESGFSFLLDAQNMIWAAGKMLRNLNDSPMKNDVDFGTTYQQFYDVRAKEIATNSYSMAAIDLDDTLVIWGLFGKRGSDWEFIDIPQRIEGIKARSIFFFRDDLYVVTLKNKIEKYRHYRKDEIESSSTLICGHPISAVKKSYRD